MQLCQQPIRGRTIVALSSGAGRAGVAVVRVSGTGARAIVERLAGTLPEPRKASLRTLRRPGSGDVIDRGIVLWLPGPGSYTGEDSAEFQVHGGRAVIDALLVSVVEDCGAQLAQPGEFTRRAFENGKLDLVAVEAVGDLISAESEAQRVQALRLLQGGLSICVNRWRETMVRSLAWLEAINDFSDSDDVAEEAVRQSTGWLHELVLELDEALKSGPLGRRIRDGFVVVIAGPVNAGKSTLLNRLAGRDVAITSDIPGTTRDAIEVRLNVGGHAVTIVDTAGLREGAVGIELQGIARTLAYGQAADLVLWLSPCDAPAAPDPGLGTAVVIASKSDVACVAPVSAALRLSAAMGDGIDDLLELIAKRLNFGDTGEPPVVSHLRHEVVLASVRSLIQSSIDSLAVQREELAADDLRRALTELGRLAGSVTSEDVLGEIFAGFCIGK